ncbi:MAG: T9SS type A sorting domain-containing protein [Bacteroidetes bacterium]|nr:T9SS type A sorting domain-containing protein [Bacteroidota bacterium]
MKKIPFILLLSMAFHFASAQTNVSKYEHFKLHYEINDKVNENKSPVYRDDEYALIVGFFDSSEVFILDKDTTINGNVLVLNKGQLIVQKDVNCTINGGIILLNQAEFKVNRAVFTLKGNVMALHNSLFEIDSSEFIVPMDYRYQHSVAGIHNAQVKWTNSTISFGKGLLSGIFLNQSSFILQNNEFLQSVTISMHNQSSLDVKNTSNAWEFLVADSCSINIRNSSDFIFWLYFSDQQTSSITFPQGNYIQKLDFNSSVSGLEDITYSMSIDSTSNIKWGVIQQAGSDLTIKNSLMRTFGMFFDHGKSEKITGLINNQFYEDDTFTYSDRSLRLVNTDILTWNFYAVKQTNLQIEGCLFGEVLAFDQGIVSTVASICDGSGGYLGAESGQLNLFATEIEAQLLTSGSTLTILAESEIDYKWLPATFAHSSIALFANTKRNGVIEALDTSFVLEVFIDSFKNQHSNSIVPIHGTINHFNGPFNPSFIRYYRVEAINLASPTIRLLVADSLTNLVADDVLCFWNTNDIPAGTYDIVVSVYINNDNDPIEVRKEVNLLAASGIGIIEQTVLLFPNPCDDYLTVRIEDGQSAAYSYHLFDLMGKKVNCSIVQKGTTEITFNTSKLASGSYFLLLEQQGRSYYQKVLVVHE